MFDYYKAPSDEVFNNIKDKAIELWRTFDDRHGYASGKIACIANLQNVEDNAWYMVAMFDSNNRGRLLEMVNEDTKAAILEMLHFSLLPNNYSV